MRTRPGGRTLRKFRDWRQEVTVSSGFEDVVEFGSDMHLRPASSEDPLDLNSKPSFPKPSAYIEIMQDERQLRIQDRKLFNLLLAESWRELSDPRRTGPFWAPAPMLRRAAGQTTQRGNARLQESLKRLATIPVRYRRRQKEGLIAEATTTLIADWTLSTDDGYVEWDYHSSHRQYLANPGQWARLPLDICSGFRSHHALVLYEHLCLYMNRKHPIWNVDIETLSALFGADDGCRLWSDFDKNLKRALTEIRQSTDIEVIVEPRRTCGRKVTGVRFTVHRTRRG